ncbi:sugar ABC transporter permease [Clostridiales bacterium FE2011]|nr:sugar ABC transporter permease [Clostridiales bacterium FE2011]
MMLPALGGFIAFYILPFEYIFRSAFWQTSFNHSFAGALNFLQVIQGRYFSIASINMISIMFEMVFSVFILVIPISVFIRENRDFSWLHIILLLMVFVPSAALGNTWLIIPQISYTNHLALLAMATWKSLGIPASIMLVGFAALDPHQEEAAQMDGATFVQRYYWVVFPQMGPSLLFMLVYILIQSQRLYRESYILFGDYPTTDVYLLQHYLNHHFQKHNYPLLSAATLIELAFVLVLIFAMSVIWRKMKR